MWNQFSPTFKRETLLRIAFQVLWLWSPCTVISKCENMDLNSGMSLPPALNHLPNLSLLFLFLLGPCSAQFGFCPQQFLFRVEFCPLRSLAQLLLGVRGPRRTPSVFSVNLYSPARGVPKSQHFQWLFSAGLPNWRVSSEHLLFLLGMLRSLRCPDASCVSSQAAGTTQV